MSRLIDSSGEEQLASLDYLSYAPAAEASGTNAAVPTTAWTPVSLTTIATDNDAIIRNNRLQPSRAGRWHITIVAAFPASAAGSARGVDARKNGVLASSAQGPPSGAGQGTSSIWSGDMDFNGTTDYVEPVVFQDSGAAMSVPAVLDAHFIGPNVLLPVRFKPVTWQADSSLAFPSGPFARYDVLEYVVRAAANEQVGAGDRIWNFVYRDDLDAAYPWHFKGGDDVVTYATPGAVLGAGATYEYVGTRFAVPRAGIYDVEAKIQVFCGGGTSSGTGDYAQVLTMVNGVGTGNTLYMTPAVSCDGIGSERNLVTAAAAANLAAGVYKNGSNTAWIARAAQCIIRPRKMA